MPSLRRRSLAISLVLLWACGTVPAAARPVPDQGVGEAPRRYSREELERITPAWPNPYLSFLPEAAEPDWGYWQSKIRYAAEDRRQLLAARQPSPVEIAEVEPAGSTGENDHPLLAQALPEVGSRAAQAPWARITGHLLALPDRLAPGSESDDSVLAARPLAVAAGGAVVLSAVIGDGVHGSAGTGSGDFDFYSFEATAGERIEISVKTPQPLAPLDPIVALYDSSATLLWWNDNIPLPGFLSTLDSYLSFVAGSTGTFFVAVGGFVLTGGESGREMFLADPIDGTSGPGSGSEGAYELLVGLDVPDPGDVDVFALQLEAGDVLGANLLGHARRLALWTTDGELLVAADGTDLSGVYSAASPLPGGGEAAIAYVIDTPGTYGVTIAGAVPASGGGDGSYSLELAVLRPRLEELATSGAQIVYLDFDGATLDAGTFGSDRGVVTLSPLRAFLPGWELGAADEDRVIDAILRNVDESLSQDLRGRGLNGDFQRSGIAGDFDVEIRNSRDHPNSAVAPHVSRIVVGGSREELGLDTIAIAQAIDVGNFETEENAVVLLDLLSAPAPNPNSLLSFERGPGTDVVELVGRGVGNIAAHEAGHLLANFHTALEEGPATLMDRGGDLPHTVGVGEDAVFGTADDQDVDFGPDEYESREGFSGTENTLNAISFGLPAGGGRPDLAVFPPAHDFGAIPVGTTALRTFFLSNEATLALNVQAPSLLGPPVHGFVVEQGGNAFSLLPGETHSLVVSFTPDTPGTQQATVRLRSDDPDEDPLDLPLSGQGGVPEISVAPTFLDLGEVVYGDAGVSTVGTFAVANDGVGALQVSTLVMTGRDPQAFRVEAGTPFVIDPGGSATLTVRFAPGGAVGPLAGRLAVLGNDPATPRSDVSLVGQAWGPDIELSPASPFHFGLIRLGTHRQRTFFVTNEGNRDLRVSGAAFQENDTGSFSIDAGGDSVTLAPGAVHELVVGFLPVAPEEVFATLRIDNDDPDEKPFLVALAGLGVEPEIAVSSLTHDYGQVGVGESVDHTFSLTNEGLEMLTVFSTGLRDGDPSEFTLRSPPVPFGILPGNTVGLRIDFHPSSPGGKHTFLDVISDDSDEASVTIALSGTGVAPAMPTIPTLSHRALGALAALLALAALGALRCRFQAQTPPGPRAAPP